MPKWDSINLSDLKYVPDCNFIQTDKHIPAWTDKYDYLVSWLRGMCEAVSPQLQLLKEKEKFYKREVLQKMNELKTAIPALESEGRTKRFVSALPAIAGLVTLAVESINGYLQSRSNKAMANALNALRNSQRATENRLNRYKSDLFLYGKFSMDSTVEIMDSLQLMYNQTSLVEDLVRNLTNDWPTRYISNPAGAAMYAVHIGTYLHSVTEKYNTLYRELIYNLDNLLLGISILSKGKIPIQLISPGLLKTFTENVVEQLRITHPEYTLALPHVSYYYDMDLVTFGINEDSALVVVFPIFIRPVHLQNLILYQIETVHVPINDLNTKADSYSKIRIKKPYLATNDHHYIQLQMQELNMCKKIQKEFYCEELFMVKHAKMHTCESTLYYEKSERIIQKNCDFDFYYNISIPPSVLDGGYEIVLANLVHDKKFEMCEANTQALAQRVVYQSQQINPLPLLS